MCNKEHEDMLYRIAYAYYEKGLTQNAIARQEHVSRPHISRLLKEAKEVLGDGFTISGLN